VRIVEFPGYSPVRGVVSQHHSLLGIVGLIAKVERDAPDAIDYPYYITAH
jgi:hypothetical protein